MTGPYHCMMCISAGPSTDYNLHCGTSCVLSISYYVARVRSVWHVCGASFRLECSIAFDGLIKALFVSRPIQILEIALYVSALFLESYNFINKRVFPNASFLGFFLVKPFFLFFYEKH